MASTSELWEIAKAQARNPMAETANTALKGIYGGYQRGKAEDKQMLEDKFKEIERIRQIMAWKQQEAQMQYQRSEVMDKGSSDTKDFSDSGKTTNLLENQMFKGDNLTPQQKRFNAMIKGPNPAAIPRRTKTTISPNGVTTVIGEEKDEETIRKLNEAKIKDYEASAMKKRADAENVGKGRSGAGTDQKKIVGDLLAKAIKEEELAKGKVFLDEAKEAEHDKWLTKLRRANLLVIGGNVEGGQKILKEWEKTLESKPDEEDDPLGLFK